MTGPAFSFPAVQIAIVTGEASGDRVAGQLAREIKTLRPDAEIWAVGGKHLRDAGAEVLFDPSRYSVIGAASAVRVLPGLLAACARIRRELVRRRPDVFVPVDAGAVNVPFCAWTRRNLPDTRILYYFPPGSWRRQLGGTKLAGGLVDRVATPFPWSESELRRLGVDATFVGHPLLDLARPSVPPEEFAARVGLDLNRPVVGLLPGSRAHEIELILPDQLRAAAIIARRVPGVQFLLALAPTVTRDQVIRQVERVERERAHRHSEEEDARHGGYSDTAARTSARPALITTGGALVPGDPDAARRRDWLRRADEPAARARGANGLPLAIVEDATYDVMAASDVLITTSGTATLEAALMNKPMVIVYRLAKANLLEFFLIKKSLPPHIGMPNLLLERRACPELVQDEMTPGNIAREVIALLVEPERLLRMKDDLREATQLLGEPGGARRAAQMVVDLAEEQRK